MRRTPKAEQSRETDGSTGFSFGKNWDHFVRHHLSQERVDTALRHLLGFLERDDLQGCTFLDIGCGSGIHSLAACRAGARRIVSFDVDPASVATTRRVLDTFGDSSRWQVFQGSILDSELVSGLQAADVVYSWGVLHHTGDLWSAVSNAASLVAANGSLYIAVYEKNEESEYWTRIKQQYNRAGWLRQRWMEAAYVWRSHFRTTNLGAISVSVRHILTYQRSRGMAFRTDVRDWLGGWPYEPASADEVCSFCEDTLGLQRVKVLTGEANIEYLFRNPV